MQHNRGLARDARGMVAATVLLTIGRAASGPDMRGRREVDAKSEQRAAMAGRLMPAIGARVYQHY